MDKIEKTPKPRSREYPAFNIDLAIEFVSKFKDYPIGKPISYNIAAKALEVSADTKSFRYMLSTARQFGLISTATGETFTILEPAQKLIRPTDGKTTIISIKRNCFVTPKIYKELVDQYNGQSVPALDTLVNVLVTYHGVLANVAKNAAKVFVESADLVGVINNGVLCIDADPIASNEQIQVSESTTDKKIDAISMQEIKNAEEFEAPLSIPFGERKRAILYMPINVDKVDAEYALSMIKLMFSRIYGVSI